METAGLGISSPRSLSDDADTRSILTNPLCTNCQEILTLKVAQRHCHRSLVVEFKVVSKSAADGCQLCTLVLLHCESTAKIEFRHFSDQGEDEVPQSARLHILQNWVGIQELVVESTDATSFQPPFDIRGDFVAQGPSWDHVPRWLEDCNRNHPECKKATHVRPSTSWTPSRLIKVGFHGEDYVRITSQDDDHITKSPYNTLSHRWGTNEMVQLKRANIRLFEEEGIPLSHLSQTFIDAIQITRKLGISYLWIDSLCIIQDSHDDWSQQSSNMHLVYSHSYLNLAASRESITAAGQGGLIGRREQIDNEWHLWARNGEQDSSLLVQSRHLWEQEVERCPLNARGWVLQERMLSPRVLYFSRSQLFWECEHFRACEKFPKGLSWLTRPDLGKSLTPTFYDAQYDPFTEDAEGSGSSRQGRSAEMENLWVLLMRRYGNCSLTRASDKLVAVAGLARRLSTVIDGQYLAGIWESSLPEGLTWFRRIDITVVDEDKTAPNAMNTLTYGENYRAPTWSWASISDGPFAYYISQDIEPLVEIVRCEVTPAKTYDEFGNLESASLCIKGDLFNNLFIYGCGTPRLGGAELSLGNGHGLQMVSTTIEPDHSPVVNGTQLWFLPLYVMYFSQGPAKAGLLLVPADGLQYDAKTFRRWGCCTVYHDCTEDNEHLSLFGRSKAGVERRDKHRVGCEHDVEITLI